MPIKRRFSTGRSIVLGLAARKRRGKVGKGQTGVRQVTRSTVDPDAPCVANGINRAEARKALRESARRLARGRTKRRKAHRRTRAMRRTVARHTLTGRKV
jgi:hypothetical protein